MSPFGVSGSCQLMDKEVELIAVTLGDNTLVGIPSSVTANDCDPPVCTSPLNTNTYVDQ